MGDDPDHGHDPAHNKADADVSIGKTGVDDDLDSVMTMMMKAETSSKNQNCFLCLLTWKLAWYQGNLCMKAQKRKLWVSCEMGKLGVSVFNRIVSRTMQNVTFPSTNHQASTTFSIPPTSINPSTSIVDPSKPIIKPSTSDMQTGK